LAPALTGTNSIPLKLIFPPIQADQMTAEEMETYLGKPIMEEEWQQDETEETV
jgi:hypothetical protein